MPQGVGYGAILRGPDGGPAIDHVTGQPLTMEELLRRQGIIPWYERVTPTGQSAGNDVSRPPKPVAGVPGATFPPSGVGGPTGGALVEPPAPGAPPSLPAPEDSVAALADDPEVQTSVASLDPPDQSMFWKMVLAGTGGTALAAWLANRLMRKGTPVPPKVAQAAAAPISVPVPSAPAPRTSSPILGSPQTMTVKPVQSNNIRLPAISTGPTIVPPVEPPLDDGVKRTLGRQVAPRSRAAKALARARR